MSRPVDRREKLKTALDSSVTSKKLAELQRVTPVYTLPPSPLSTPSVARQSDGMSFGGTSMKSEGSLQLTFDMVSGHARVR
jgi:hypothetical protein